MSSIPHYEVSFCKNGNTCTPVFVEVEAPDSAFWEGTSEGQRNIFEGARVIWSTERKQYNPRKCITKQP